MGVVRNSCGLLRSSEPTGYGSGWQSTVESLLDDAKLPPSPRRRRLGFDAGSRTKGWASGLASRWLCGRQENQPRRSAGCARIDWHPNCSSGWTRSCRKYTPAGRVGQFADLLSDRSHEGAEALLSLTDALAASSTAPSLRRSYSSMRSSRRSTSRGAAAWSANCGSTATQLACEQADADAGSPVWAAGQ